MALGSAISQKLKDIKSNKKGTTPPEGLALNLTYINRCEHPTCQQCRKHTSCCQRPKADNSCTAFEEGPAWDHQCEGEQESDY